MKRIRLRRAAMITTSGRRIALSLALAVMQSACATFHPFRAELGSVDVDGQLVHPSYLSSVRYFGYLQSEDASIGDANAVNDERAPFVYAWLAHALPELGVRVVSPSASMPAPQAHHDVIEPSWTAHASERSGFDACVRIERCVVLRDPTQQDARCERWLPLGDNEDSSEVPPNPQGEPTNAVVRVQSNSEDPLFSLVRGLYRVQFARCRQGPAQGPFVLELGAPMSLEGAAMARSESELSTRVRGVHAHVPLLVQPARDGFYAAPGTGSYAAPVPDNLAPPASTTP